MKDLPFFSPNPSAQKEGNKSICLSARKKEATVNMVATTSVQIPSSTTPLEKKVENSGSSGVDNLNM